MTYRHILTLVGLLLCVQGLFAQTYQLQGKVTDALSGEPLAGATIHLQGSNNGVFVGPLGTYTMPQIQADSCTLIASFIGYESVTKVIYRPSGNLKSVHFKLTPTAYNLNEVVVTGTGTEHYLKDAPVQTEVISGKALKEYAGRDIEDVLSGLSSSLTFTASEMGSGIHINGLKNDYVLILLDGRRMNTSAGGQNDLSRINMQNIQRIEIVKGAASSLYGSDAIGGVINFISKKNTEEFSLSNTTRVGEHEDIRQSTSVVLSSNRFNSTTSFDLKHTHGWQNTNQEWHRNRLETNSVTRTVNRSTNYTLNQQMRYCVNKQLDLYADAAYYEKWTNRPLGKPNWRYSDLYYRNQTYGLGTKYNFKGGHWLSFDSSFDRNDYFYDYTTREYTDYHDEHGDRLIHYKGDRVLQSSQRRWINNFKGVALLGETNTLQLGVEHIWDKLVAPYRLENGSAHAYSIDAYIQDEWNPIERLNITAGMRYGHHRDFERTLTPKLSTLYKWGNFNLRATYSHGFKAPTMKELYYHYYATIMSKFKAYYGDANLKPQRSNYYALNLEYNLPRFKASVTAYHNNLRDLISLQSTPTSYEDRQILVEETMHYVNLAKARTYGIDFTFNWFLPKNFKVSSSYSYLNAKAQRTDDEKADNYMQYVPINASSKHNATLKLQWSRKWKKYQLAVALNGRYQSKRYYTSHGNAKAHQLWRINTNHNLLTTKKLQLAMNVGVDNLFDYVDRTPFGHNSATKTPGRNYYLSVALKFQNKHF